jgi:hypothetical protein
MLIEDGMNYPLIFFYYFFINFLMRFFSVRIQEHLKTVSIRYVPHQTQDTTKGRKAR